MTYNKSMNWNDFKRERIYGGDINDAWKISDGKSNYFLKTHEKDAHWFYAEAHGLEAIQNTHAISTPKVIDVSDTYLCLEYIEQGRKSSSYWQELGQSLAHMHLADTSSIVSGYGFYEDNFIGYTKQINLSQESWISFFRDCRLKPQFEKAKAYISEQEMNRVFDVLDDVLIEPEFPSLVHGDLWAGNQIVDSLGHPVLIDPACYIGHFEVDLAMTELFGGFPSSFYEAYNSINPIDKGYTQRKKVYNLYHLLNHLNCFGLSYLSSVRQIIDEIVR